MSVWRQNRVVESFQVPAVKVVFLIDPVLENIWFFDKESKPREACGHKNSDWLLLHGNSG